MHLPRTTFRGITILCSIDSSLYPPRLDLVFKALWCYIPEPVLHYVRYLPAREYRRLRTFLDYSLSFSRDLVGDSVEDTDGKDIMSVLLRANASENDTNRMSDDETFSQVVCVIALLFNRSPYVHALPKYSSLLLAGHETTANSLGWFLWEMAKHPESQERIRAEIAAVRARKGDQQISVVELDNMTYTQAALKVLPRRPMQALLSCHD